MPVLSRCRVSLSGPPVVGGGVATFYVLDGSAGTLKTALDTFWNAVRSGMPTGTAIVIPSSGEELDPATGTLVGAWTAGSTTTMAGSGGTTYASGVGCRVVWETAGITNGRRVRGSTYLVPLANGMYDTNGNIDNGIITSFQASSQALITALGGTMAIWHRPSTGGSDGVAHEVIGRTVPDAISWLRSRRT
jgi:hypothetical protein